MENEIWKPIPDCEGYFVSNLGRFKNSDEEIKQPHGKDGYQSINLKPYGGFSVHRLVAIAFIPNPDNKPEVNHINGNKTDNRVVNLEWSTRSENNQHAWRTGLNKGITGKHHSEETKQKMSESLKGHEVSEETKQKMSETRRGHEVSEETRKKMSEANKGRHTTKGTIWINNGTENHMIKPEKLQDWFDRGYVLGQLRKGDNEE